MAYEDPDDFEEIDPDYESDDPTGKRPKFLRMPKVHEPIANDAKIDALVELYKDVRDQLTVDRRAYKERETLMKDFLAKLGLVLRERADALGVDSFPTRFGTAYRLKKERFPVEDWSALTEWIKATGNFQVLQRRTSPDAVREVRDEGDALPPGVGYYPEITFTVRANAARKK